LVNGVRNIRLESVEIPERTKRLLDKAGETLTVVVEFLRANERLPEAQKQDLYRDFTELMLVRGLKTYKALLTLCSLGFGEDALVLHRALLETLINVLYVSKGKKKTLARRFFEYELAARKKMADKILSTVPDELEKMMPSEDLERKMAELERGYEKFKRKYDIRKEGQLRSWSGVTLEAMAREVGLQGHYDLGYRLASQIAHSSAMSLQSYVREDGDTLIASFDQAYDSRIGVAIEPAPDYLVGLAGAWGEAAGADMSLLDKARGDS
jgi:hypothetical protein